MPSESEPKIIIDEDWKSKVEQERSTLETSKQHQEELARPDNVEPEFLQDPQNLPPADFHALLQMLVSEAMVSIGVWPHPSDNKPHFMPNLGRHFIDLISVLEQKTKGNLSHEEAKNIEQVLHQLRMTYVAQQHQHKK